MHDIMVHTGRHDAWGSGVEYAADLAACAALWRREALT